MTGLHTIAASSAPWRCLLEASPYVQGPSGVIEPVARIGSPHNVNPGALQFQAKPQGQNIHASPSGLSPKRLPSHSLS